MWVGAVGDALIGPHVFQHRLTGAVYHDFSHSNLLQLLENVPTTDESVHVVYARWCSTSF